MVKIKKGASFASDRKVTRETLERSPLAEKIEREVYRQQTRSKYIHVRACAATVEVASHLFDAARALLFDIKDTQSCAEDKIVMDKKFIADMRDIFNRVKQLTRAVGELDVAHNAVRKKHGFPVT